MSEIIIDDLTLHEELVECVFCRTRSKVTEYVESQGVIILKMECGHLAKWVTIHANNQIPRWAQVIDANKLQVLNGF